MNAKRNWMYIIIFLCTLAGNVYTITAQERKQIAACCMDKKEGRCTGSAYCTACKNCSRCKHCSNGGSCGVCQPSYRGTKTTDIQQSSRSKKEAQVPTKSHKSIIKDAMVSEKNVALRSGPSSRYKIIGRLKYKEKVLVLRKKGNWYKVQVYDSGKKGYVYKKRLQFLK